MKYLLSAILLFIMVLNVTAQTTPAFNTTYYWLKEASSKAATNDTTGCLSSIDKAIQAGLFDTSVITGSKTFTGILSQQQKASFTQKILFNRSQIATPSSIQLITEDIDRFWQWYPAINKADAETVFMKEYIEKGSKGLQTFFQIRMNNSLDAFIKKIRSSQLFYNSIKDATMQFTTMRPQFVAAASQLENLYPESVFPPIYFLIGNLNNVGTADGYAGLLIGTEHLCRHQHIDTSQLTVIDKMVLFDTALAVPLIVHEYVHFQQKNKPEQTLLELSIMEGVADFITYLVTGKYTNSEVYQYGFSNEAKLWTDFSKTMNSENIDAWLFNAFDPQTGYPGNLGYFIGFRICESYYNRSADKSTAIKELIEIKDFNRILAVSGYKGGE